MKKMLLVVLVAIFMVAPVTAGKYLDGSWGPANDDRTSPASWKELDVQYEKYLEASKAAKSAFAEGDYQQAYDYNMEAAGHAVWSWIKAWKLNNAAFAKVKLARQEDSAKKSITLLEEAVDLYNKSQTAIDTALSQRVLEAYAKSGHAPAKVKKQMEQCQAVVTKSSNSVNTAISGLKGD